jgi:hypothetical protein
MTEGGVHPIAGPATRTGAAVLAVGGFALSVASVVTASPEVGLLALLSVAVAVAANIRSPRSARAAGAAADVQLGATVGGAAALSLVIWLNAPLALLIAGPFVAVAAVLAFRGAFATTEGRAVQPPAKAAAGLGAAALVAAITLIGAPLAVLLALIGLIPAGCALVRSVRFGHEGGWLLAGWLLLGLGGGAGVLVIAGYLSSFHLTF